ncbi:hypothetical protein N7G274_004870 [Stereocaulon virgatum]|uniref:Uncharacterized protein n=1 Tax=Stereocaulon virgatum TaxID=373712 RepID=A0ABR4A9D6_9LECA
MPKLRTAAIPHIHIDSSIPCVSPTPHFPLLPSQRIDPTISSETASIPQYTHYQDNISRISMHLPDAGFNFTNTSSVGESFSHFIHDRSFLWQVLNWIPDHAESFVEWLRQPHILAIIMAWAITFTVVLLLSSAVGFGPMGIGAGTLAAAFQGCAYGGFTPAGGIFATLTSMGMLGWLMPVQVGLAAVSAFVVALIVWGCGVGR